jgi:topoisomerase IV subunit A
MPGQQPQDPTLDLFAQADLQGGAQPPAPPQTGLPGGISFDGESISLADFAERAYLDYAVSVVKGRALPDLCDGLKPVQRRILFAMDRMSLAASAKPVKSARVVGDVLGKYHPHGDQSAYDALVRLAQGFTVRYPLIDGQGNFGSRDGDGAAAMRYTEARLTRFADLLLSEIDEGTVDFSPNYDGSMTEPQRMPARLPVCLLNGASGIAVGMATEIPPHNLREVAAAALAMLETPDLSMADLMRLLPGPDFPGGGQVISSADEIAAAYSAGKGSLKMRARWVFEELARSQWQLVVNELPHGVSAQKVLEEIEELTNPKVKAGKKSLSPEQQQTKQLILGQLESVRDESGKDAAVRLVFEPRSSRLDRDEFVTLLLAHTSLQSSVAMNLVAVDFDGRPRALSLREILGQWLTFRVQTVRRRSAHRLAQAEKRIHILEGRTIALARIDDVIRVIRESDEPKPALIAEFGLSELQAEDILEIRLRQLARLEAIKIEKELAELRGQADRLRHLLENEKALKKAVGKEIAEDAKTFGDDRRTVIKEEARATVEVPVIDEPVTVVVSVNGWVRARQGHGHDPLAFGFKTGDALYATFECRTVDMLVALSNTGRSYSVAVSGLPGARGDGAPMTSMIELEAGSRLVAFVAADVATTLVIGTTRGQGFVTRVDGMVGRNRSGKQFMTLDAGDEPSVLRALPSPQGAIAVLTEEGRMLIFGLDEVKELATGGRGVSLIDLELPKDRLVDLAWVPDTGLIVCGEGRAGKPTEQQLSRKDLLPFVGKRARKGKPLGLKFKPRRLAEPVAAT